MDVIPPGSRGAARLAVIGNRSNQGSHAGVPLVTSQQWLFPTQQASSSPRFSISTILTRAGSSTSARLTPPTLPRSSNPLSIYPDQRAEAGASVDADIISAQRFLREHCPEVDVQHHILSRVIYDNAVNLQDAALELGGSLGIADSQAVALLRPITTEPERIFAIACVGGSNRDCLLLHQLQVVADDNDAFQASEATQGKRKASGNPSTRLSFKPAHRAQRRHQTPILQIVASADQTILAVRTHSSTSFLSVQRANNVDGTARLHLETVHQVRYGTDDNAKHVDVCFRRADSALEAVTVDRNGNVELFHFVSEEFDTDQDGQRPIQTAPGSPLPVSSETRARGRKSLLSASPTLATPLPQLVARRTRIAIDLTAHINADPPVSEHTDGATDADGARADRPKTSEEAFFRIVFGPLAHQLYLLTKHTLIRVDLEDQNGGAETQAQPQLHTVLRSDLCLTSFERARLFSMAANVTDLEHHLLAVCSSDAIYWLDLNYPSQPLFSVAHHRGDDPTLFLAALPTSRGEASESPRQRDRAFMWTLSSKRNDAVACYTVQARLQEGRGDDLFRTDTVADSTGARWLYTLDSAPVGLPTISSSSQDDDTPAAPVLFTNAAELVDRDDLRESWIALRLDQRGALLAHMLQARSRPSVEPSEQTESNLELDILEPPSGCHLYVVESGDLPPKYGMIDALSQVEANLFDFRKLYHAVFAFETPISACGRRSTAASLGDFSERALEGRPASATTTLSFGQLLRSLDDKASVNNDGVEAATGGAEDLLNLRRDCRQALAPFVLVPAQASWSRLAASMANLGGVSGPPTESSHDIIERTLKNESNLIDVALGPYLPANKQVQNWGFRARHEAKASSRKAARKMVMDLALETEVFVRPRARILDAGAPTQRPQQQRGTNWTALEYRDIFDFVEEEGQTIPPPHIGSIGMSFFSSLRSADVEAEAAKLASYQNGRTGKLDEAELEALLPSTSSTARLLLSEWQLGEDPTQYKYTDPFEGLHRLPRASRLGGPTARARSRSFSRASSVSTEDRSRSRSRSRKQSAAPSTSQHSMYDSQPPSSSYPASLASHSQYEAVSPAPPTLVSRRNRQRDGHVSRSQPVRALDPRPAPPPSTLSATPRDAHSAAQSQPAPPRFGFAGSFGNLTPRGSPASSQIGTPTRSRLDPGAASTQIEAGRFGARPVAVDRPPKKKKRASGF